MLNKWIVSGSVFLAIFTVLIISVFNASYNSNRLKVEYFDILGQKWVSVPGNGSSLIESLTIKTTDHSPTDGTIVWQGCDNRDDSEVFVCDWTVEVGFPYTEEGFVVERIRSTEIDNESILLVNAHNMRSIIVDGIQFRFIYEG